MKTVIYLMIYLGSALMIYNIIRYFGFTRKMKWMKNGAKNILVLYTPMLLLILFLIGYLLIAFIGKPDLLMAGILFGVKRSVAAEFSFFMAIPIMFGASALKLVRHGLAFSGPELLCLLLGMAVAFLVSVAAIRFLMEYIRKKDFQAFGVYRIVLGILVILYFGIGSVIG